MKLRSEIIDYCSNLKDVYEDYPFHDTNWTVMRHKENKRVFSWIYEKDGLIWVNVKCNPESRDFFRTVYPSVVPAYHLNKEHWNSIILDGTVPKDDIKSMIEESYELTKGRKKKL